MADSHTYSCPPVLFIVFKRPDTTARVFDSIRSAHPSVLYIAADGPRPDRKGEAHLCDQVRTLVSAVDWPCRVQTWFRESNVGIKENVSKAISWFLDNEQEGIILEDDCCPNLDFFEFASDMLDKYRDDKRVMHISGSSFQPVMRGSSSYFFSRYNHGWGWATWKRAWDLCDLEMTTLDPFLESADRAGFWLNKKEKKYWTRVFDQQRRGLINTWDYQWKFTLWREGGVAVYPQANMVSNLGFNQAGTNTLDHDGSKAERGLESLLRDAEGQIMHPVCIMPDRVADAWTFQNMYWGSGSERFRAMIRKLSRLFGKST